MGKRARERGGSRSVYRMIKNDIAEVLEAMAGRKCRGA